MPRNERALQHKTEPRLEFFRGIPSDKEGQDGDKRFCYIPDKGLYHYVRYLGKWMSSPVYEETLGKLNKGGLHTENLTSDHDIRLNPARNVEIKEKKDIGTGDFTAGFVSGAGWRLRHVDNEYNMEVDSMTVRGTLHVYEMLIQQLRATNGTVVVSSAAKTESATSSTITFDDPSGHGVCPFADNDIIMCQRVNLNSTTVVKRIVRRVTDVNGKTVTITRDGDLPSDTLTIEKGDDFVRIGNTTNTDRRGGVLITSDLANAPFIEIFDGVSSWSTWGGTAKIKARLGQLSGIVDTDAGLNDDTKFGLYTNDVNLKGHLFSQSGEIAGWDIGSATLSKNNATLSSSGILTLGTGTDIVKLDATDSTYRIWAGHTSAASAPFKVHKDGTLTATGAVITGNLTATTGAVGGWSIDSDSIYSGSKDASGYTASNGDITITSAGGIHTPKFYVDSSGNAAFKGTITIGSTDLDETNTLNANTTSSDVGLGNVDNDSTATIQAGTTAANVGLGSVTNQSAATTLASAATAANTANKTDGAIGPVTITGSSLYQGTGTYNNSNTGFYMDSSGNFSLKDKLAFNGTTLSITGAVTATSGTFYGDISIGDGNAIFKASGSGIQLGHATFGSAPFRVTPAGVVVASDITLTSGEWNLESGGDAYFSSNRIKCHKTGSLSIVGREDGTAGIIFYPGTNSPAEGSHTGEYWSLFQGSGGDFGVSRTGSTRFKFKTDGQIEMASDKYLYLGQGASADTGFRRDGGHLRFYAGAATTVKMSLESDGDVVMTGNLSGVGALSCASLDTGQGANELYDMNQNVKTDSDVTFNNVYATAGQVIGFSDTWFRRDSAGSFGVHRHMNPRDDWDGSYYGNLGWSSKKWRNINAKYTSFGDITLNNNVDAKWTLREKPDCILVRNDKTGKIYTMNMTETNDFAEEDWTRDEDQG